MSVWIKVCGVTTVEDAVAAIEAGVDAIGLNFVPSSKRYLEPEAAASLIEQVGRDEVEWVGVVADDPVVHLQELRKRLPLHWWQLHGKESPEELELLLPSAYKALPIANASDVARAERFGGERLLVDAHAPGQLGGTGRTFEWGWISELVTKRRVILAGGLTPENVGVAVRQVAPWGVDVASGVESAPGKKDIEAIRKFVRAARDACLRAG